MQAAKAGKQSVCGVLPGRVLVYQGGWKREEDGDMTHLWVRAEQRPNEERVGLTPEGAAALVKAGIRVTVERSSARAIGLDGYVAAGCEIAEENLWPKAPADAIIFGLKELPEDGTPLRHRHIMFGHAYKGQPAGRVLLQRFKAGGGVLYDLEYLVGEDGRRVAAFGYWAGYAGAAVSLKCWAAQQRGGIAGPVRKVPSKDALLAELGEELAGLSRPRAIIIGALGRVEGVEGVSVGVGGFLLWFGFISVLTARPGFRPPICTTPGCPNLRRNAPRCTTNRHNTLFFHTVFS